MHAQRTQHREQLVQADPRLTALKLVEKPHADLRQISHVLLRQLQVAPASPERLAEL